MKNAIYAYVGSGAFTEEDAKKLDGIHIAFGFLRTLLAALYHEMKEK